MQEAWLQEEQRAAEDAGAGEALDGVYGAGLFFFLVPFVLSGEGQGL